MWIEIAIKQIQDHGDRLSLPAWGVWIEIDQKLVLHADFVSLPAWGVWIEMLSRNSSYDRRNVAPRMGSVD